MAGMTGIWNQAAAMQNTSGARPQGTSGSSSSTSGSSSSSGSNTITSNDFLTLLCTELKNQDPTSQTDPNQYVNQLVSINSLEQLISINQNTTGGSSGSGSSGTSGTGGGSGAQTQAVSANSTTANPSGATQLSQIASAMRPGTYNASSTGASSPVYSTSGNLSTPATNPAAIRVAQALGGR